MIENKEKCLPFLEAYYRVTEGRTAAEFKVYLEFFNLRSHLCEKYERTIAENECLRISVFSCRFVDSGLTCGQPISDLSISHTFLHP